MNRMLSEITWKEFVEWMVYADLEPFDEVRADLRSAQIVAMIANVNRDTKKRKKPYETVDLLLRFGDDSGGKGRSQQTWQQMKAYGQIYAVAGGAKIPPSKRRP